jgi:hypothetical protein
VCLAFMPLPHEDPVVGPARIDASPPNRSCGGSSGITARRNPQGVCGSSALGAGSNATARTSGEKVEASLRRIEEKLATLPDGAPKSQGEGWRPPETPLQV